MKKALGIIISSGTISSLHSKASHSGYLYVGHRWSLHYVDLGNHLIGDQYRLIAMCIPIC
jgi:hypothetical protein